MPYEITQCYLPAEVTFPPLPQPKLVLDLATPEGCKAELTWVVVVWMANALKLQDFMALCNCRQFVGLELLSTKDRPVYHPRL